MSAAKKSASTSVAQPASEPGAPVGFMSPQQLHLIADGFGAGGRYIPMRKTPVGMFTLALYTAPPAAARVPLTPDRDKLHRAFRDIGYTTNGQTSDLLDLVFNAFEAAGQEGGAP